MVRGFHGVFYRAIFITTYDIFNIMASTNVLDDSVDHVLVGRMRLSLFVGLFVLFVN